LGARPPRAPLFSDEDLDSADGWTGDRRIEIEIDAMIAHLGQLVEEVGGKVFSQLTDTSFLSWKRLSGLHVITGRGTTSPCFSVAPIAST
jgi:hypothetical protein